jgi:hypothetical protein
VARSACARGGIGRFNILRNSVDVEARRRARRKKQ